MDEVKDNIYKEINLSEIELNHQDNSKIDEKEKEKGKELNYYPNEKKPKFVENNSFKKEIITKHISLNKNEHKSILIENKFGTDYKKKSLYLLDEKIQPLFHQNELKQDKEVMPEENMVNFSINQLENNIQMILNNMKLECAKSKNKSKKDLNIKVNHRRNTLMLKAKNNYQANIPTKKASKIKRAKSFVYSKKYKKKLFKRMRDKVYKYYYDKFKEQEIAEIKSIDEHVHKKKIKFSIHPNSTFIFIFDIILIFATLLCCIFIPLKTVKSEYMEIKDTLFNTIIEYFIDIIYIADFLISFFRGYYNHEMKIVRYNKKILKHYLVEEFFMDLIEAIPLNVMNKLEKFKKNNFFGFSKGKIIIKLIIFAKSFKIFKILKNKKNKALDDLYEYLSKNYYLEKFAEFIIYIIICILFAHLFICFHLFFAYQSYPNWMSNTNLINTSFRTKYIASFYFLMTTMTTVGYGDIVCISSIERIFHIILLAIGTLLYTFIVSTIGNYLREQSHEQIKLNKDMTILENIRITHPKMPFKLYSKIQNHLLNISNKRKKTGISLLLNGIPDTIKNDLLFKIYSKVINDFSIFKNVNNSRFILQVLTSFIPITLKKEEILLSEGEAVDNIMFVKDGRLSMEIKIDINEPYISIKKYWDENFVGISKKKIKKEKNKNKDRPKTRKNTNYLTLKTELSNFLSATKKTSNDNNLNTSLIKRNGISADLGRLHFERKSSDLNFSKDFDILKIFDIRKNEDFGEVHMFLNKPSPFTLKAKSRIVEILLLRKNDVIDISENFPSIWQKIYDKSYHNLVSIKKLTYKILKRYFSSNFHHKQKNGDLTFDLDNSSSTSISLLENSKSSNKSIVSPKTQNNSIRKNKSNEISLKKTLSINNHNKKKIGFKITVNGPGYQKKKSINSNSRVFNFSKSSGKSCTAFTPKGYGTIIHNINDDKNESEKSKTIIIKDQLNDISKMFYRKSSLITKNKSKFSLKNVNNYAHTKTIITNCNDIMNNSSSKHGSDDTEILTNKNIKYFDKSSKTISSNSIEEENFCTLENIDKNFSEKIKKMIKMKSKFQKIKSMEEEYNNLIELYSYIIENKIHLNDLIKSLHNNFLVEPNRFPFSKSNSMELSRILDSSKMDLDLRDKLKNSSLKAVLSESFVIKSSYDNINILTKGIIIKNMQYKNILKNLIQQSFELIIPNQFQKSQVEEIINPDLNNKASLKSLKILNFNYSNNNVGISHAIKKSDNYENKTEKNMNTEEKLIKGNEEEVKKVFEIKKLKEQIDKKKNENNICNKNDNSSFNILNINEFSNNINKLEMVINNNNIYPLGKSNYPNNIIKKSNQCYII
mgnify:CR=1 FL=1